MFLITLKEICLFVLFLSPLIVSLISFISNPNSSSGLTIFIISSIFLFEIINAVVLDPWIWFWLAASAADVTADNPNGTKTLLANGLSILFLNGKPVVINGLRKFNVPPS